MNQRWKLAAVLVAAGSAIVLLALWVRNPVLPYGGGQPGASGSGAPAGAARAGSYESEARARGLSALRSALTVEQQHLQLDAQRALGNADASLTVDRLVMPGVTELTD